MGVKRNGKDEQDFSTGREMQGGRERGREEGRELQGGREEGREAGRKGGHWKVMKMGE